MIRLLSAFVAAAIGLSALGLAAPAQEKVAENRLTYPDLMKMVENMGYETKDIGNNNFEIRFESDGKTNFVALSLSPDRSMVWLADYLIDVKEAENTSGKAWFDLVTENNKIGPSHFAYDKTLGRLYLHRPIINRDATPARLRENLSAFARHIRETDPLWNGSVFAPSRTGNSLGD